MTIGVPIIDADSHWCEPPDLWVSRMSASTWGDAIPQVRFDERIGLERWYVGGTKLAPVASWAYAGWSEPPPGHPPTIEAADPAAFFAPARLAKMDAYAIYAQVLYPNLLAFTHHAFTAVGAEFATECVRAYNDALVDFAAPDPKRFIVLAVLPFWDVEAATAELERCAASGQFRGVLFLAKPQKLGLPDIADEHWSPLFARVNELGWSMNFHTGFAEFSEDELRALMGKNVDRRDNARLSACSYLNNGESIANVVMSGLCDRYPKINFVWVESAFGWMPSFVESMDWQWLNAGAQLAYPDLELPELLLPSPGLRHVLVRDRSTETSGGSLRRQPHVRDRLPPPDQPLARTRVTLGSPRPRRRQVHRRAPRGTRAQDPLGKRRPRLPRRRTTRNVEDALACMTGAGLVRKGYDGILA